MRLRHLLVVGTIVTVAAITSPTSVDAQLGGIATRAFGARAWRETVTLASDLPATGNRVNDLRYVIATATLYRWDGTTWIPSTAMLPTDPASCPSGQFVRDLTQTGSLVCATPEGGLDGGSPTAPAFSPLDIPDLRLWLRATDIRATSGDTLSTWYDSSGSGRTFTDSGQVPQRPTFTGAVANDRAAVQFSGTGQWLSGSAPTPGIVTPSSWAVVVVFRATAVTRNSPTSYNNDGIFVHEGQFYGLFIKDPADPKLVGYNFSSTGEQQVALPVNLNTWHVVTVRHSGGTLGLALDGEAETSITSGDTADLTGRMRLGFPGQTFTGSIAEVMVFDPAPAADELIALVAYLSEYYRLTS